MPCLALVFFTKGNDWSNQMTDVGSETPLGIILWLSCPLGTAERPEILRRSPSTAFLTLSGNREWGSHSRGWLTAEDGVWRTRSMIPTVSTVGTPGWSHQGRLPGSRKVGLLSWIWNENPDLSFMLPPHIHYIIHSKCNHFGASMGPWRHSRVFPLSFFGLTGGCQAQKLGFLLGVSSSLTLPPPNSLFWTLLRKQWQLMVPPTPFPTPCDWGISTGWSEDRESWILVPAPPPSCSRISVNHLIFLVPNFSISET